MGPYSCSLSWQQGLEPGVRIKPGKIQAPSSPKPCLKASARFAELLLPPALRVRGCFVAGKVNSSAFAKFTQSFYGALLVILSISRS